jgi:hypothetical protein
MTRTTLTLALLLAACGGEFHTPPQDATVGMSAISQPRDDTTNTMVVSRMRLVVGAVQLVRNDGEMEQLDGPFLLEPKLDGSYAQMVEHVVDHGAYTQVVLSLRPLSSQSPAEVKLAHDHGFDDLLQANSTMAFEGTYGPTGQTGTPFQVNVEGARQQTVSITDDWNVKLGTAANVTLSTDVDRWFARDIAGHPIDPRNTDVDDALRAFTASLHAEADDDRSGTPDH